MFEYGATNERYSSPTSGREREQAPFDRRVERRPRRWPEPATNEPRADCESATDDRNRERRSRGRPRSAERVEIE
ncbi:hypothetical protein C489_11670 [Natrinema versiforme JCM 10478]|uniref:Uncharacterized protein n=1 Tax=Natrinema versiforme JCM 10478 TaxID=1227496 RepID=L9XZB2_9EURY|nr:hypothetical protein C489_11670 [Natrinema versiforme JCM 10478]